MTDFGFLLWREGEGDGRKAGGKGSCHLPCGFLLRSGARKLKALRRTNLLFLSQRLHSLESLLPTRTGWSVVTGYLLNMYDSFWIVL